MKTELGVFYEYFVLFEFHNKRSNLFSFVLLSEKKENVQLVSEKWKITEEADEQRRKGPDKCTRNILNNK